MTWPDILAQGSLFPFSLVEVLHRQRCSNKSAIGCNKNIQHHVAISIISAATILGEL